MRKIDIKFIASSAIIAALYAALTWLLAPISYGSIQFRISEILVLLVFFNPKYALAIILGTFISNTTSTLGWYDMVFGTLATTLSVITITKCKNIYQAALAPVVFNGVIVALELYFALDIPVYLSLIFVSLGEAVVLFLMGIPTMNSIMNNEVLLEILGLEHKEIKGFNKVNVINSVAITLSIILVVFFFTCPILDNIFSSHSVSTKTLMDLSDNDKVLITSVILPVLYLLSFVLMKGKLKMILTFVLSVTLLAVTIYTPIRFDLFVITIYYYIYMVTVISLIIMPFIDIKINKGKE